MKAKMENFLKWLWLVNGFLALFWMGIGSAFFLVEIVGDLIPDRDRAINVTSTDGPEERGPRAVRYDSPITIYGTKSRMVKVRYGEAFQPKLALRVAASGYSRSYFGRQPIVNVIFLDSELRAQSILLDTPAYIDEIRYPDDENDFLQRWISYKIAVNDSNGDGVLDEEDEMGLFVSDLDGMNFRQILPASLLVTWHEAYGNGDLILIYALEKPGDKDGKKESFPQRAYLYDVKKSDLIPYQSLNELVKSVEKILP